MEGEVTLRVRKSDLDLLKQVMEPATKEYKAIMQKEVLALKGKDIPLKLIIDEKNYLPEYSENEGQDSCMGGLVLTCRRGRIVCSNTLDERLSLCYQEAIPDIRSKHQFDHNFPN